MPRKRCAMIYPVCGMVTALCLAQPNAAIEIQIDYTYDSNNFFGAGNPNGAAAGAQARAAIESAASFLSTILTDSFSAIETPEPFSSSQFDGVATWDWSLNINNPSTGSTLRLNNPSIAESEYRVYVGGRALAGTTLGFGGPGGFGWSSGGNGGGFTSAEINQINQITTAFSDAVENRGEVSGFARWGGAITFDNDSSTNWHFDHTVSPEYNESDFFSVAIHELTHVLGFGASQTWDNWVAGMDYTGPQARAEFGGLVPLDCSEGCGHWAEGTQSTILGTTRPQETLMDPTIATGTTKQLTTLDAAGLTDIGWSVVTPIYDSADYDLDGDVDSNDLSTLANWYGINGNGDADGDSDTDGADFLLWQKQYTGSLPLLTNVPEPTSFCLALTALLITNYRRRY